MINQFKEYTPMKKSIIIILATLPLVFSSCASSRFFSQQRASDLSQIALVEPFAYITDAIGDWSTKYLDDASKANQKLVAEIVTSMGLPIEKTVPMEHHTKASAQTDEWLRRLSDLGAGTARNLVIPDDIRDAVSRSGCRYGLLISDLGFIKNPDIYAFEQALDTSRKVMDALMYNRIEIGSDLNTTGKVVWYGSRPRRYDKNPLDHGTMSEQLQALFKDFR